ncbi:hypothetical protein QR680_013752 [Steinernema hermaphroditum]|uniref:Uncharacterized protein n=1 Tax=Steinernema hermaphroditum TaxID=289476 RepID=A0AA39M320_9BILA|nr:hypothetical protein QR680_013752 [Steinernema hermaphroditum]
MRAAAQSIGRDHPAADGRVHKRSEADGDGNGNAMITRLHSMTNRTDSIADRNAHCSISPHGYRWICEKSEVFLGLLTDFHTPISRADADIYDLRCGWKYTRSQCVNWIATTAARYGFPLNHYAVVGKVHKLCIFLSSSMITSTTLKPS